MTNHDTIRRIERYTLRAWQALENETYDGWILRYADGYTGRANSVQAFFESSLPLAEKIAYCENWYAQRGQPTRFRLNAAMSPANIDDELEARDYIRYNETLVQTSDIRALDVVLDDRFSYEPRVNEVWLRDFAAMNYVAPPYIPTARAMLRKIETAACFGHMGNDAVGLAVCEGDYVGLFDIVVAEEKRGKGLGRALVTSLLAWAKAQGATTAYLQVVTDNHIALRLYQQLGFSTHHNYWYRRQPSVG